MARSGGSWPRIHPHQPALCDEVEVVAVEEPDEAYNAVALGSHGKPSYCSVSLVDHVQHFDHVDWGVHDRILLTYVCQRGWIDDSTVELKHPWSVVGIADDAGVGMYERT